MSVLPAGGFAEYAVLPAQFTFRAPASLDDAEAAALTIAYQTGWFALHRRTRLMPGETVLVHAAAGGVGTAAIQLAKAAGARVIGVVGGPEKAGVAAAMGADVVIDRRSEDIVARVKAETGGRGVDVVYDPVGGASFTASTKCIAFEGRILVIGFASGDIPSAALNHALVKNYSIIGLHWGLYRQMEPGALHECHTELERLVAAGTIRPWVSARYGLDQVVDALEDLAGGTTTGRVAYIAG